MLDKKAILEAHHERHACKVYDPVRRVSEEDMRFILEIGRLSPSSFGFEPWKFLVIENSQVKEMIRDMAWGAREKIMDCSHCVVIVVRQSSMMAQDCEYLPRLMTQVQHMSDAVAEERLEKFRRFCREDFDLVDSPRAFYDWACKQSYIALANMMTAAAMIGVDSTAVEGFPLEPMDAALAARGLYDRAEFRLSVMVTFGYRKNAVRPKTRRAWDDVVQWVR